MGFIKKENPKKELLKDLFDEYERKDYKSPQARIVFEHRVVEFIRNTAPDKLFKEPGRYAEFFEIKYGLNGKEPKTLKETAKETGVSHHILQQIISNCRQKIKRNFPKSNFTELLS